jgi:ELWxxDGT repeat protein
MLEVLEDRCLPASGLSAALVADIAPGSTGSNPAQYVVMNNTLYFAANDGVHGTELYKSDGTASGTVLVKDINPGSGDSNPTDLTPVGTTLYFSADDGVHGQELWKTDGSAAGTVLVKDINPGNSGSGVTSMADINGTLFFCANDGTHGAELWKSDGTAAGTVLVKDINSGSSDSNPGWLTNVGGVAFFSANDGTHGNELWKSDGTASGTVLVKDIWTGTFSFDIGGRPGGGRGTPASSVPTDLTNVNGTLFFFAWDNSIPYLYKTDGTAKGTVPVSNATVDTNGGLVNAGGTLFFGASDHAHGTALYKSDGTAAGTLQVADIKPGYLADFTNVNGIVFFKADDGVHGAELWKTDGTAAGTVLVKDIYPGTDSYGNPNGSDPYELTNVNGLLYFSADDGVDGRELWQSDGTTAGTVMVQDINPGSASSGPQDLVAMNNKLYFSADDGVHGRELWDPPPVGGYTLGPLVQVSSTSLYAGSTADHLPSDQILLNSEDENQIAVDPTNPNHFVALWQGDETAVGNRGQNVGVSFDGGQTWTVAPLPLVSQVTGGPLQSTADPWLTFAPNGDLYATCLAFTSPQQFVGNTVEDNVEVLKSTDGGLIWSAPTILHDNTDARAFNDKESITADTSNPNLAYMAWDFQSVPSGFATRNEQPVFGGAGIKAPALFSRTTDGGQTWEPARVIYDPGANAITFNHQVLVRPDGTLLDVFEEGLVNKQNGGSKDTFYLSILESADQGQHWSPNGAAIRTNLMQPVAGYDPDNGIPLDDTGFLQTHLDVAMDPHNGYLYAVWMDGRFSGGQFNSIAFSMSTDGGSIWSAPIQVNKTPTNIPAGDQQALMPSVKVAADGTVAVTYYDFRNNDASPGLPTDYWVVFGKPTTPTALTDPANWGGELRLTDHSFDLEKALFLGEGDTVPGLFLGDYEGLKAVGNDFVATFCQAGVSPSDPKSIFFRRILSTSGGPAPEAAVGRPTPSSAGALAFVGGITQASSGAGPTAAGTLPPLLDPAAPGALPPADGPPAIPSSPSVPGGVSAPPHQQESPATDQPFQANPLASLPAGTAFSLRQARAKHGAGDLADDWLTGAALADGVPSSMEAAGYC